MNLVMVERLKSTRLALELIMKPLQYGLSLYLFMKKGRMTNMQFT